MTDKEITVTVGQNQNGDLVDLAITRREDIEHEVTEIIDQINEREAIVDKALEELGTVAIAAQNPEFYKALAALVKASSNVTREKTLALKLKADQIERSIAPNQPAAAAGPQQVNNTLIMTTTDMLDKLKGPDSD